MSAENSNISRWIAFLILPLATLVGAFVAIKAKAWFNYDLDPAAATAYIVTIVGGIAGGIIAWLHNRGEYEIAERLNVDPDQLDTIVNAVLTRLPEAPAVRVRIRPPDEENLGGISGVGTGGTSPGQ